MWVTNASVQQPSDEEIEAFVATLALRPLSYETAGMTTRVGVPPGYRQVNRAVEVGDWDKAVAAVRGWTMHDQGWASIRPSGAPI